jgi:small subunit ribosomal protein S6
MGAQATNPKEGLLMSSYELAILFDPDLEIDLEKPANKVKAIITDAGGKITGEDNWGKRKLAYTIKGHDMAVYVFYTAELDGLKVKEVEAKLNITDEVIRFLVTKPDTKAIAKAEAIKASRAAKRQARKESEEAKEGSDS